MRIAVFGGSFDPPHIAHEKIVKEALTSLEVDKLFVVPTYLNPFKNSFHLTPQKRFELLKKIFNDEEKVTVFDYEINQNRAVPSYETITYLKKSFNPSKIYLILGSDNIEGLKKWYKYDELEKEVEFVLASRTGYSSLNLNNIKQLDIDIDISSTTLRDSIDLKYIPKKIKKDIQDIFENRQKGKKLEQ